MMKAVMLRLPESVVEDVRMLARQEGISMNQLMVIAVTSHVAVNKASIAQRSSVAQVDVTRAPRLKAKVTQRGGAG